MAKNQLALEIKRVKLQAFRAAMDSMMMIMTIALNDVLGVGRDRMKLVEKRFNELYQEYGELVKGDIEYGNAKLKARVEQIMKEGSGNGN